MKSKELLFQDILVAKAMFKKIHKHFLLATCGAFFLHSCLSVFEDKPVPYETKTIEILTYSLFNQQTEATDSSKDWKGDWIFRRERLNLIDDELLKLKPDLIFFQELLQKKGNPLESDQKILSSSSLSGYSWYLSKPKDHSHTGELESLAVTLKHPLSFSENYFQETVDLNGSTLFFKNIKFNEQNVLVINMNLESHFSYTDTEQTIRKISTALKLGNTCRQRLLLVGHAPPESFDKINKIKDAFNLKDSAKGFCNMESHCYTASPSNLLFQKTYGEAYSQRVDFILINELSIIHTSSPAFSQAKESKLGYYKQYGMEFLFPSVRFAWLSEIRLPRCSEPLKRKNGKETDF